MYSLYRDDESLETYDQQYDDQIDRANSKEDGWYTAQTGFVVQTREEAFAPAQTYLINTYVAPLGQSVDTIIFDAESTVHGKNQTPGVINRENGPATNDLLFGEAGGDTLHGGAGNDVLYGDYGSCTLDATFGSGADKLFGGDGNDVLIGGAGGDELDGGDGNDTLYGDDHKEACDSPGADKLTGGTGDDKFVIDGNDVITDPENGDRVGIIGSGGSVIWLEGGYLADDSDNSGEGRAEGGRCDGTYTENTNAGTVTYIWCEGNPSLEIHLLNGGITTINDWDNGKAGIELTATPDDGKVDQSDELTSPLVVDLDRDGIELLDAWRSRTYFDLDNDGFAERTGWVAPDDGLLALDVDGNGTIDNITELFGVEGNWDYDQLAVDLGAGKLPSGFDKLRLLDSNADGVIDAADPIFADLKVWQDSNSDGISQAGELHSLSSLGIESLSLTSTQEIVYDGANAMTDFGSYTKADGTTGDLVDVWFGYDGHITKDLTPTPVDPATANLPKLHGYGEAGSLSEAMSADPQLLDMVTEFKNLSVADASQLESRVEEILLRWYEADGVDPLSRGECVDGRWVTALERIYGDPWDEHGLRNPRDRGGALLAEAWRDYKSTIMVQLLAQTPLGQVLFPGLAFAGMAFLTLPDTFSLQDALTNLNAYSPADGIEKLQFWHSMILALDALYPEFKETVTETYEGEFEEQFVAAIETALAADGIAYGYEQLRGGNLGTHGDDILMGVGSTFTEENPELANVALLVGGDGNDTYRIGQASLGMGIDIVVEGTNGGTDIVQTWETYALAPNVENLTLLGTAAINGTGNELDNIIVGNSAGNTLSGMDGNDSIIGGAGNDVLNGDAGDDVMTGGANNDLYVIDSSADVINENAGEGTDSVQSSATYTLAANVENLTLTGSSATNGTGNFSANTMTGNTGNNILSGLDGNDTIDGGAGNDSLSGGNNDDSLIGGAGTDSLDGGAGNDTVQGGSGADSISLGTGKDRVVFSNVLDAGDVIAGFGTSGTEQDSINLDALFDALNGGVSSAARTGRVQLVATGADVELRIDTAAGTGVGDGVGDVTLMVFAGMTTTSGLSVGNGGTYDIQIGTA